MFYKNLFSPKGGDIEKEQESDVKQEKKVGLHDSEVISLGCAVIHQAGQLLPYAFHLFHESVKYP